MNWLNNANSTTMKVATGCLMALILVLFYCIATASGKEIEPVAFGEALAFAATFAGIAYAQFAKKRETEIVTPPQTTADHALPSESVVLARPIMTKTPPPGTNPGIVAALTDDGAAG